MKKILLIITIVHFLVMPVYATEVSPPVVPESGEVYMPPDTESFSEGVWYIFKLALNEVAPSLTESSRVCLSLICIVLLVSILHEFSKESQNIVVLIGSVCVGLLLFKASNSLIRMATNTVQDLSQYGKLLLPAMTAAMAAEGGHSSSAALYTGTMLFCTLLTILITKIIVPLIYIYLCLSIAYAAIGEDSLNDLKKFVKWLATWSMKIVLYVFTGYITITKIITGAVDATSLRVAKIAISGVVPVVGKIISDASDTILLSAGMVKNGAGIYGLLAIISVIIGPFLKIGVQYILFKLSAAICSIFGIKRISALIADFSKCLALSLAMVGILGLMLIVSTVCFLKGIQ